MCDLSEIVESVLVDLTSNNSEVEFSIITLCSHIQRCFIKTLSTKMLREAIQANAALFYKNLVKSLNVDLSDHNKKLTVKPESFLNMKDFLYSFLSSGQLTNEPFNLDENLSFGILRKNKRRTLDDRVAILEKIRYFAPYDPEVYETESPKILKVYNSKALVIFDGHGGFKLADYAAFIIGACINEAIISLEKFTIKSLLLKVVELCNDKLRESFMNVREGTTISIVLITDEHIYTVWRGDSQVICFYKDKTNLVLTVPLHDINNEEEMELYKRMYPNNLLIKKGDFVRIDGDLVVSRSIGDFQHQLIDESSFKKIPNKDIDFILLGTDGFWENLKSETILLLREKNPKRLDFLKSLNDIVTSAGTHDNASFILTFLEK